MNNLTVTELISEIRSNENIIHQLSIIETLVNELPYISNKLFLKDSEGNSLNVDEYCNTIEDFCSNNTTNLMRDNRQMFKQIKSIKE